MIPPPAPRRPAPGGGLAVLVVITVLASLAAPHATALRSPVTGDRPVVAAPESPGGRSASRSRPARAVAFALAQRGKPYRWGAQGPGGFDCSGLTWAAWRSAGVTIPRTAAGQLAGLPRVGGRLRPGDLVIMLVHDDPAPGLSARGLLTIALAAAVVILLTLHRGAGPGPLVRTLGEYAVVFLLAVLLATTGIGPTGRPSPAGKQASTAVDQRPALVKTVDRSWDRLTGAWDWLTELWRRADTKTAPRPEPRGAASAPSPAPQPSTWRPL